MYTFPDRTLLVDVELDLLADREAELLTDFLQLPVIAAGDSLDRVAIEETAAGLIVIEGAGLLITLQAVAGRDDELETGTLRMNDRIGEDDVDVGPLVVHGLRIVEVEPRVGQGLLLPVGVGILVLEDMLSGGEIEVSGGEDVGTSGIVGHGVTP